MNPRKYFFSIIFLLTLTFTSGLFGEAGKKEPKHSVKAEIVSPYNDSFPVPPRTDKLLFYIQRSKNKNTIVYELNKQRNGVIDRSEPVHVYWRRYAFAGDSVELSYLQHKFAYGVEAKPTDPQKENYQVNFVSYSKRYINLVKADNKGHYNAYTTINGKQSILDRIFLKLNGGTYWFPSIEYVEIDGRDAATNKIVMEKFKP